MSKNPDYLCKHCQCRFPDFNPSTLRYCHNCSLCNVCLLRRQPSSPLFFTHFYDGDRPSEPIVNNYCECLREECVSPSPPALAMVSPPAVVRPIAIRAPQRRDRSPARSKPVRRQPRRESKVKLEPVVLAERKAKANAIERMSSMKPSMSRSGSRRKPSKTEELVRIDGVLQWVKKPIDLNLAPDQNVWN